jgi:hypothetical protein
MSMATQKNPLNPFAVIEVPIRVQALVIYLFSQELGPQIKSVQTSKPESRVEPIPFICKLISGVPSLGGKTI